MIQIHFPWKPKIADNGYWTAKMPIFGSWGGVGFWKPPMHCIWSQGCSETLWKSHHPRIVCGCRDMLRAIPRVMSISGTLPNPIVRPCNMYRSYIYTQHDVTILEWIHTRIEVPQNLETALKSNSQISKKSSWWKKHRQHLTGKRFCMVETIEKPTKKTNHQVIQSDPIFSLGGISLV